MYVKSYHQPFIAISSHIKCAQVYGFIFTSDRLSRRYSIPFDQIYLAYVRKDKFHGGLSNYVGEAAMRPVADMYLFWYLLSKFFATSLYLLFNSLPGCNPFYS